MTMLLHCAFRLGLSALVSLFRTVTRQSPALNCLVTPLHKPQSQSSSYSKFVLAIVIGQMSMRIKYFRRGLCEAPIYGSYLLLTGLRAATSLSKAQG